MLAKNREYRLAHPEKVRAHEARQRLKNPEKYRAKKAAQRRRQSEQLADGFVRRTLAKQTGLPRALIPGAMIEAKRAQLRVVRLLKETGL